MRLKNLSLLTLCSAELSGCPTKAGSTSGIRTVLCTVEEDRADGTEDGKCSRLGSGTGGFPNVIISGPDGDSHYPPPDWILSFAETGGVMPAPGWLEDAGRVDVFTELPTEQIQYEEFLQKHVVLSIEGEAGTYFGFSTAEFISTRSLAVGAPGGKGAVYLLSELTEGSMKPSDATLTVTGVEEEAALGWDVAALGDAQGNEYMAIAAPFSDEAGVDSGVVYLISLGLTGELPVTGLAEAGSLGPIEGAEAGHLLAAADFDGDGADDLAIAAPGVSMVFLVRGPDLAHSLQDADGQLLGPAASRTGQGLALMETESGEVTLLIGAPDAQDTMGAVYSISGGRGIAGVFDLEAEAPAIYLGEEAGGSFGKAVAGYDGLDGRQVLVGEPGGALGAGALWLFDPGEGSIPSSKAAGVQSGGKTGDQLGVAVSNLDVDADGVQDVGGLAPGSGEWGFALTSVVEAEE